MSRHRYGDGDCTSGDDSDDEHHHGIVVSGDADVPMMQSHALVPMPRGIRSDQRAVASAHKAAARAAKSPAPRRMPRCTHVDVRTGKVCNAGPFALRTHTRHMAKHAEEDRKLRAPLPPPPPPAESVDVDIDMIGGDHDDHGVIAPPPVAVVAASEYIDSDEDDRVVDFDVVDAPWAASVDDRRITTQHIRRYR
jgi:hypothetical protein